MPQKFAFSAIICELDPLHHGHRLLLERAGESGAPVFCVMSGCFVQRGAPAMLDKWTRARLALMNGADLVIELPLSWACAGAERFAAGGVALAGALGAGRLFFGSEVPDADLLLRTARALLSPDFSRELSRCPPDAGFAPRRQAAVGRLLGPAAEAVLQHPNANLGVEYCRALISQGAPLEPVAVRREGAAHGSESVCGPGYLSASALRRITLEGGSLEDLAPDCTVRALEEARSQGRCAHISHLERAILCRLRGMDLQELARLPDLSGGLEHRLFHAVRRAGSIEELYALAKSRRVSHARVRRLVLSAFLGVYAPLPELPPYLRLLGATSRGLQALGRLRPALPVVARSRDVQALPQSARDVFALEARAGDLYGLATPAPMPAGRDYTERFIRL